MEVSYVLVRFLQRWETMKAGGPDPGQGYNEKVGLAFAVGGGTWLRFDVDK